MFDGSETSIGGDGEYIPHNDTGIPSQASPNIVLAAGNGSGCVTEGPFKNMTVRLGPMSPAIGGLPANPLISGLGLNERCLRRDLSNAASTTGSTETLSCKLLMHTA